ncbi:hypothetical protein J5U23_00705 [Saccharolobus shibatae B12]|uniref:Uncharacterized protein n=1 Tax=Saccharolobus shibatae (strain ATCC 51178 / DSM 5389 / JCM 8931 / NBRC 15437 / B12) TaxID=523848 RepID=A0A8F5BM74_SACSH|nr:hypothetical protein J5U23_00705 [Saccharolobus shibatae B12]
MKKRTNTKAKNTDYIGGKRGFDIRRVRKIYKNSEEFVVEELITTCS